MPVFKFNESEPPKPPAVGARKGEGRMSDSERQGIIAGLISDAESLVDGELSPDRARATDYYLGRPFGNEEIGRSQVVLTEVRDTVHGTLPDLLRMFFGPETAVEFTPKQAAGVAIAKQATDYVQFVFAEDNKGFMRMQDVLLDGLVRKIGIFKWGWEDGCVRAHEEDDASEERLEALAQRPDVELTKVDENKPDADDDPSKKTFTVHYTVRPDGRARVWSVPPEEFIFTRGTRELEDALFVGHRREMARGDLLAMGISKKDLDEHGGRDAKLDSNIEAVSRDETTNGIHDAVAAGEANEQIIYVEGYALLDVDGDGERELRNVCTIGPSHYVVTDTPADELPFSIWSPYVEPHTLLGQSMSDLTMDLQLIKSSLVRGTLDSFALSLFPRTTVLEGMASIEDVLNNEIGAPIRIKKENAVVPFNHPFTGEKAMSILAYFDDVSENRTGRNKGAAGLDADALQSSTKQAVNAAVTASQAQKELLARNFAEQALKPLFRGVYRLLVKNQTQERLVKLRGSYVPVNPAQWDADMDVTVNVALGTSLPEQRIQTLMGIAEKQEQIIQMLGPGNPLCTIAQLRETYARIVELSGFKDITTFFKEVPADWQPPPAPAPQKSPEQTMAEANIQVEQMRMQKDLQIKEAELQLKLRGQEFDHQLKIKQMANDFVLRRYAIDAQFHSTMTQQNLEDDARSEEAALSGAIRVRQQQHTEAVSAHERSLAEDQQSHDQQMAERQQATAEQQAAAEPTE